MPVNIAIDGPAGAGKSSVSKLVAKELDYIYVDTGALYRAVGQYALNTGADTKNAAEVEATLPAIKVELKFLEGEQRVYLNGNDVSEAIRAPEASMAASDVSAVPAVRAFLFDLQRNIAAENNCVMDGRDIGTVVFPEAELQIFVTASAEIRAQRRYKELQAKGMPADFDDILKNVEERDYIDSHRATSPLRQADDAIVLDNSHMTISQQKEWLAAQFEKVCKA